MNSYDVMWSYGNLLVV